jgi:hypothetical protein
MKMQESSLEKRNWRHRRLLCIKLRFLGTLCFLPVHLSLCLPLLMLQLQLSYLKIQMKPNVKKKLVPPMPPVPELAPSEDTSATTDAPATASAVVATAVPTLTKAASNLAPLALSVENWEAPPSPSTPEEAFSLATAAMAGIEKHGTFCQQIVDMMPTINTATNSVDISAVRSKIFSMKDAKGSSEAALLGWETLRCEFRAMRAAAPG